MRKTRCVLLVGVVAAGACRASHDVGAATDLAQSRIADGGVDLAPTTATDLALPIGVDLLPPPETVSVCPDDQQTGNGTNTVIRVHASWLIDTRTVSTSSLVVQLAGTPIGGAVSVSRQDLTFTPTNPLPANATLQASLAADVRDTLGRPLWPSGRTWSFVTGADAQPTIGFKFTPPICPYTGDHTISRALTRDGSQTFIAWSDSGNIVATSLNTDASDFVNPLIVSHTDVGLAELSMAAVDGVATFAYAMTVNSPLVYWSSAQDDWKMPATEQLLSTDPGQAPSVAVASGGDIAIVWEYGDPEAPTARLITSSNSGTTFSAPTVLDAGSSCSQVLYQNGRLVVAWLDSPSGGFVIKAMSSTNNGATFSTPVTLAMASSSSDTLGCPQLVDVGNGDVLFVYSEDSAFTPSIMLGRYTPSSGAVAMPKELYPSGSMYQCAYLAASPGGKLVLSRSTGTQSGDDWTTELRTSGDYGKTFDAATSADVVDSHGGCPLLTITDDSDVTMAWARDSFQLQVSRGHRRRPCE